MTDIRNTDDIINSRDVIDRIEELQEMRDDGDEDFDDEELATLEEELATLEKFAEEGESATGDWPYGATLINDDYFVEYAQELAEETGAISPDQPWPMQHIDWESAADELRHDYTPVDFDGVTYWTR